MASEEKLLKNIIISIKELKRRGNKCMSEIFSCLKELACLKTYYAMEGNCSAFSCRGR